MSQPQPYRVWAEIDLGALQRNADRLAARLNPDTAMLAVLKADAYGHGAIPVARALGSRVRMIGVGDSQEALELRAAGITTPLLVLGTIVPGEIDRVVAADITVCVADFIRALQLNDAAARQNTTARVHLLVDTGMHRLGVRHDHALALLQQLHECEHLHVEGICTHFSTPGESQRGFTHQQLARFLQVLSAARDAGLEPELIHAASSGGLLNYEAAHLTMVRPGIALHGINPGTDDGAQRLPELEPTLALRTQIAFIKDLPEGSPVSYSRTWYAPAPTRVATLPVGYNDGFRRLFSNPGPGGTGGASVLVRGQRCPVVGRVTMDYTMIDVGAVPDAEVGDVVTLIGRDGDGDRDAAIRVEELAALAQTIPYDITCGLGRRVVRLYRMADGEPFVAPDATP